MRAALILCYLLAAGSCAPLLAARNTAIRVLALCALVMALLGIIDLCWRHK